MYRPTIINQHVVHFEVCLLRLLFGFELDKSIAERLSRAVILHGWKESDWGE